MTQEYEALLALAAAHLLDPARGATADHHRALLYQGRPVGVSLAGRPRHPGHPGPPGRSSGISRQPGRALSSRDHPPQEREPAAPCIRRLPMSAPSPTTQRLELRAPKRHQAPRKPPLPTPTAKRLLAAPQPSSVKGVRDLAILTGMLCHGLAVSELCALNVADLDLAARTLRVTGRRGRVRTVELTAQTAGVFRRWLATRALLKPDTTALFIALHWTSGRAAPGQRISVRGVRALVHGYLAQVGVSESGVSCQALRRTYTALTLAAGADLRAVAASLGHASTATTQTYAADAELVKDNPARYLSGLL